MVMVLILGLVLTYLFIDILLNDESIELSKKFRFVDDQIDEDIDLEI